MNRLAPVLYIRSTLASSRDEPGVAMRSGNHEKTKSGQDKMVRAHQQQVTPLQLERPQLHILTRAFESESTLVPDVAEKDASEWSGARREIPSLFASQSGNGPFQSAEPSGDTPPYVQDDPFESAFMECISVGFVPVYMPRVTEPIAPCVGFAMQAEIIQHTSKFAEFRKAQRKALPERERKVEESEGGVFFASRERGQSPSKVNVSNDARSSDHRPSPQKPPFDYLRVEIPSVSIVIPSMEGNL